MIRFGVREPPATKKLFFLGNLPSNKMDSLAQEAKKKLNQNNGFIMKSLDPTINNYTQERQQNPEIMEPIEARMDSIVLGADPPHNGNSSIILLDDSEKLKIQTEDAFLKALKLERGKKVKVVSIFGNTGEGKSYTMNKIFFDGEEIFKTSSSQTSCTLGVWAKYDPNFNVICLDTEGLLGITKKENQRTRLLLKVLAVSDIIIYRTTAERLQRDLYTFLGGASKVYQQHFSPALQKILTRADGERINAGVGPGVIIFHQTQHTDTLDASANVSQSTEEILRQNFADLDLNCNAFSFFKYIGYKMKNMEGAFTRLKLELDEQLKSADIRSPREAKFIYRLLKDLNEKFQSPINDTNHQQYLSQFFTCPDKCQSCKSGCRLSMGHKDEDEPHLSDNPCIFQHQYQNCVYLCKQCYKQGNRVVVKSSLQTSQENSLSSYLTYVWSGYVIECKNCGEIYRSRQHWYGNKNPEDEAVRLEIVHIWPGEKILFGAQNTAQKVVDGIAMFTDAVSSVSSQPLQKISDWTHDKVAPRYWRPNHEIRNCNKCNISFIPNGGNRIVPSKHHCRGCGEGFCESCSSQRCAVPHKGWTDPVRVCDSCYDALEDRGESLLAEISGYEVTEVRARYISETVLNTISAAKSVVDMSKDCVKEIVRPSYWTPDSECTECILCKKHFGAMLPLHHCRDCGKGVCDSCSSSRKAVPLKGWDSPVRVCDACR